MYRNHVVPRITMISKLPQSQASILGGRRSFYHVYARETLEICHLRWFSADSRLLTSHFNLKYTKNRPVNNRAATYG